MHAKVHDHICCDALQSHHRCRLSTHSVRTQHTKRFIYCVKCWSLTRWVLILIFRFLQTLHCQLLSFLFTSNSCFTDFIFAYLLISKRSFRISEYQLSMHWHIRILMRAVYDTIPVCANAVSQHHQDCDNIQMISSPQPLSHLTIYGNGNSHQCNKLKVLAKQLTNYAPTDHTGIYVCIWKVHACTRLTHEFISLRICHENKCFVVVVKSSNMSIVLITWTILWGKQQPFSILFFPDNYCCLFSKISNKTHFDNMLFYIAIAEEMHKFIAEQLQTGRVPLCINPQSAAFKSFAR